MANGDFLSQEEIDALLKQNSISQDDEDEDAPIQGILDINDYLSPIEQDALGEIGNICFANSATALSQLLGQKTDITTPSLTMVDREQLQRDFPQPYVCVAIDYTKGFDGTNLLVVHTEDAKVIADLMMGGDGTNTSDELSELHISAVQEAMNQMMGSSATAMSTLFNRMVDISPPKIDLLDFDGGGGTRNLPQEDVLIKVSFNLKIGNLVDSNIMQLLTIELAKEMVDILVNGSMPEPPKKEEPKPSQPEAPSAPMQQPAYPQGQQGQQVPPYPQPQPGYMPPPSPADSGQLPPAAQYPGYPYPPPYPYPPSPHFHGAYGGYPPQHQHNVQNAQFAPFGAPPHFQGDQQNLNLLLDIPLQVTVELGRTKKQIKEILDFSKGSVIELDKLAGEPVDIMVNNKLVAKGEVVVIDENFGVRITEIISQLERIQNLQ